MGLDFSHCDAHWSYSGFHLFRKDLALAIGVNLEEMEGFGGTKPWSEVKDDIVPLLNHSDCDGSLGPEACRKVAKRLAKIIKDWSPENFNLRQAKELIRGMKLAAKRDQRLEFC